MKHLGDITKINGWDVPVVDIGVDRICRDRRGRGEIRNTGIWIRKGSTIQGK